MVLTTEFTKLLNIQHPVVLAGMGQVAGGPLVAAVSNAGGLGVVGGALYTPQQLRDILQDVKVMRVQSFAIPLSSCQVVSPHQP